MTRTLLTLALLATPLAIGCDNGRYDQQAETPEDNTEAIATDMDQADESYEVAKPPVETSDLSQEATQPETTQPETTQPETTQPETTQPETTQPETSATSGSDEDGTSQADPELKKDLKKAEEGDADSLGLKKDSSDTANKDAKPSDKSSKEAPNADTVKEKDAK